MRASNVFNLIVMARRRSCRALAPIENLRSFIRQKVLLDNELVSRSIERELLFPVPTLQRGDPAVSDSVQRGPRHSGFSLVELMVVLAVAGILLGVALPSYQSFVASTAVTTAANDLVAAVNIARSEALKRDGIVSLQALNTSTKDFSDGYCVVVGAPGNCADAIRQFTIGGDDITLVISGGYSSVSFDGLGGLSGTSGTGRQFNLCRANEDYRLIDIKLVGRPALSGGANCP